LGYYCLGIRERERHNFFQVSEHIESHLHLYSVTGVAALIGKHVGTAGWIGKYIEKS